MQEPPRFKQYATAFNRQWEERFSTIPPRKRRDFDKLPSTSGCPENPKHQKKDSPRKTHLKRCLRESGVEQFQGCSLVTSSISTGSDTCNISSIMPSLKVATIAKYL